MANKVSTKDLFNKIREIHNFDNPILFILYSQIDQFYPSNFPLRFMNLGDNKYYDEWINFNYIDFDKFDEYNLFKNLKKFIGTLNILSYEDTIRSIEQVKEKLHHKKSVENLLQQRIKTLELYRDQIAKWLIENGFEIPPKDTYQTGETVEDEKKSVPKKVDVVKSKMQIETHDNYRTVKYLPSGETFHFTSMQAEVIRILHEGSINGNSVINQGDILTKCHSVQGYLGKVFGYCKHPSWGNLIIGLGNGAYKLNL